MIWLFAPLKKTHFQGYHILKKKLSLDSPVALKIDPVFMIFFREENLSITPEENSVRYKEVFD